MKRVAPAHSRRQIGLITGRKAVLIVVGGASSRRHFRDGSSDSGPTREDMEKLTALTDLRHRVGLVTVLNHALLALELGSSGRGNQQKSAYSETFRAIAGQAVEIWQNGWQGSIP